MSDSKGDQKSDQSSDLAFVTTKDEILRILRSALADRAEVHCEVREGLTRVAAAIPLEIQSQSGMSLTFSLKREADGTLPDLDTAFRDELAKDVEVEIVLSLVDGQYAIREKISDVDPKTFTLSVGGSILRLQRRSDFRVAVRSEGFAFIFSKTAGGQMFEIPLSDLSAGGMRVTWQASVLGDLPESKQLLVGELKLSPPAFRGKPGEKTASVKAQFVRDLGPENRERPQDGNAVSFRFLEMGQEEARTILFACLSVHRARYALR